MYVLEFEDQSGQFLYKGGGTIGDSKECLCKYCVASEMSAIQSSAFEPNGPPVAATCTTVLFERVGEKSDIQEVAEAVGAARL